jgi:hypothetical protein
MARFKLQIAMFVILVSAIAISGAISMFLAYSDSDRFVQECFDGKRPQPAQGAQTSNQTLPTNAETKQCMREIFGNVAQVIAGVYGPLSVIMLSIIFMAKNNAVDVLDVSRSYIALSIFTLLQIVSIIILVFTVFQTPDLTVLRGDAESNAIFTSLQGIVVAFAFPRSQDGN